MKIKKTATASSSTTILILVAIISFHPIWKWYLERLHDGTDEKLGLLALVTAIGLFFFKTNTKQPRLSFILASFVLSLLYICTFSLLPPLGRAIIALTSLSCLLASSKKAVSPGFIILLLLSLPVLPTLQFMMGFPARALSTELSKMLLTICGFAVEREGTTLLWSNKHFFVDTPCSGIKSLWLGWYLLGTISLLHNMPLRAILPAASITSAIVFLHNTMRCVILFLFDFQIIPTFSFVHTFVGVSTMIGVAVMVIFSTEYFRIRQQKQILTKRHRSFFKVKPYFLKPNSKMIILTFICLHIFISLSPQLLESNAEAAPIINNVELPHELDGELLGEPIATDDSPITNFPGQISRFRTNSKEVIFRSVHKATRRLHPASDCFRALGYSVTPTNAIRDSKGVTRSCISAEKKEIKLKVCEFIQDTSGRTWSDPSSWYWATILNYTKGPWLAITTAEIQESDSGKSL